MGLITPMMLTVAVVVVAEYENMPRPTPKPRLDPFGVRTAGSKLVSEIERRLNQQFENWLNESRRRRYERALARLT